MLPSILIGDRVIVNKLAYDLRVPLTLTRIGHWENPQRSDIVTFESPKDGLLLIKRVIGIPGDIVGLEDNRLSINGVAGDTKNCLASLCTQIYKCRLAIPIYF